MLAYLDLPIGISGNMLLGALLDAGFPAENLQATFDALHIPGLSFVANIVTKNSIAATHVEIIAPDQKRHRHLADIEAILQSSNLPSRIQDRSLSVFRRLAQAEARVHGTTVEQVHFHEVGALDAIADIVGAVAGFDTLDVDTLHAAPIPFSHGTVRAAHGLLPVPPPAVLALCEGFPTRGIAIEGETVTPTGAALLTTLVDAWGPAPTMKLDRVGQGAGTRDFPIPNIVRLLLGEPVAAPAHGLVEPLALLETNLDDMNPEWLGPLLDDLLHAGALDTWFTPIFMKKNRSAVQLSVLCSLDQQEELRTLLFAHTTTLGVRTLSIERHCLRRRFDGVETAYGPIRIKLAEYAPGQWKAAPEYEDCRHAAQQHNTSLGEVYAAAVSAWRK